jgi:type IV pilus assembly protein PilO
MDTKNLPQKKTAALQAIVEKAEKLVLWQRVAILVGVLVVLVGSATWFLFLPTYEEIEVLDTKLQELEKQLATAKINAAELEKFQAKMQEAEAQFKIAMRALPEQAEVPSLLTNVSKSGVELGVDLLSFKPAAEVNKEFYAELPMEINIRGDYHHQAMFFDRVARLSRIININNISISADKAGRDLNTLCTAVTYKFIEPAADKPPAAAPAVRPNIPAPAAKPDAGKPKKKLDL